MSVQDQVKQFIVENFYVSDPAELGADTSLITEDTWTPPACSS